MVRDSDMMIYPESIFDTISAPVMILNASREIIRTNDAFERLTGYSPADPKTSARWPFISAGHEEIFMSMIRKAFLGDPLESFDISVTRPDGTTRDIRWNTMLVHDAGDPQRNTLVVFGLELRKLAEETLEKRLAALTRPLDDAVEISFEELFDLDEIQRLQEDFAQATGVASIITHTDGTPITKPSCFCRLCIGIIRKTEKGLANCYKSDAMLGRFSTEGPTIQPCMSGGLWDAGAGITVGGRHIANWLIGQVRDKNQTEDKMRDYAREIGANEEEFVEAFHEVPAMSRDQFYRISKALFTLANQLSTLAYQNVRQARYITERKRAEEDRLKLEHQLFLSEKMKAIGQLAGGVAHDFNNILMGILGNASLMQMECNPDHPHHRRLSQIEEHVKRGANLTRQLLGFAREGKYEVKTLSINDLIRRNAQLFLEARKEIEVEFHLREDVYPVDADAGQIEQVLLNIYINAAQAMPKGGSLRIQTANATFQEADARIFEMKAGDYVRISITDTGTGMDKEILNKIFEPFFTTKSQQGGTGLGLASAYGIIRNHGGVINAYSEPGHGSTFNIYLPSSGKNVEKENDEPEKNLLHGSGGILLVDDETMILELACNLLKMLGYSVFPAESAQEAVTIYCEKKDRIDLVILDMILPGMSGADVLKKLKDIDPDVKVILSSGYGLQGEVREVMEMGCHAFVQKPYNFTDLSRIVHQVLYPSGRTGPISTTPPTRTPH